MDFLKQMPFISGPCPGAIEVTHEAPLNDYETVIPLSKVQQALWLDYLRRSSATHYNLTLQIELSTCSVEQLLKIVHDLAQRHSMLRSTFHLEANASTSSNSYMAVHSPSSRQAVEIVCSEDQLQRALRQGFNLSAEFPIRWILHQRVVMNEGSWGTRCSLYIVGHHIAVDGVSMSNLSRLVLESFAGTGTRSSERTLDYGDFVQRQDAYLISSQGAEARKFWHSQLQDCSPIEWIGAEPRPPTQGAHYRQMHTWAEFSNQEIQAWGKLYKTSWFRIATSIVSLVVAGNSKPKPHHDQSLLVAFGARPAEFQDCISHMANTMPIKMPVSTIFQQGCSFSDLVRQVGRSISLGKKHELYPFLSLVEKAQENMGEQAVAFRVAVTFSPKLADTSCTLYPVEGVWDLFFCFLEHETGVSLGVIADPSIFSESSITQMRKQFLDTVRISQETAEFSVLDIPYLQGRKCAQIVDGPSIDSVKEIGSSRVDQWVRSRASSQPDALAFVSAESGKKMTYLDMQNESNRRARYLQNEGMVARDVVMLHMDRGFDVILWILAILQNGGTYVVIEKDHPNERKKAIYRVADASWIITDLPVLPQLFADCAKVPKVLEVTNKTLQSVRGQIELPLERSSATAQDLAYMIFTSGSTGQPKCICVQNSNLSHYVSACREIVKIGPGSRVLQFASFAFDASVLEWAVTLAFGGTLCFVDHPKLLVGDYLSGIIGRNEVNFFHTTPSVLGTVPTEKPLPSLRLISVGGEPSSAGILQRWRRQVTLLHSYGPTESTVIITTEPLSQCAEPSELPDPFIIGRPLPNCQVWICEEGKETPLELGRVGEICVIGPQVSRGYKGLDELTARKFVDLTIDGVPNRLYRTGDRGFIRPDNRISIQGRLGDREVKLRGYRLDLSEIEKSILTHSPEVMSASVQLRGESLVALLVPETVDCNTVRQRLLQDLPTYAVPTELVPLHSLPLNINGKVSHAAVVTKNLELANEAQAGTMRSGSSSPREAKKLTQSHASQYSGIKGEERVKQTITRLWMEVLRKSNTPATDITFFEAGGHSILLTALQKKIALEFPNAGFSLLDAFQNATITKQTAKITGLLDVSDSSWRSSSTTPSTALSETSDSDNASTSVTSADEIDGKESFAIIGMAGRFPGANNVDDLWDLFMQKQSGLTKYSSNSPPSDLLPGEIFVPVFGSLEDVEEFDASAWSMDECTTKAMDPQKRIFLQVAQESIEDAGLKLLETEFNDMGVFVGAAPNTYQYSVEVPSKNPFEKRYRTLLDPNISTFTSFKLNLNGPNLTVNTACASSLVAIDLATKSLRAGACSAALVGGVSIAFPQIDGYVTGTDQIFSPSGECRPFEAKSDGAVPADAVTAIILKPLHRALADSNKVYAVIEGCAVGTDGCIDKAAFTVPSSTGQAMTICAAIRDANVPMSAIRYIELHGSGTAIGDGLEISGLHKAKSELGAPAETHDVYVGSNKGNLGNTEAASGVVSVIKAALALSKGVVPPLQVFEAPNPLCAFGEDGIKPLVEELRLEPGQKIGVSAIGYGGTNAHCILSAPPAQVE